MAAKIGCSHLIITSIYFGFEAAQFNAQSPLWTLKFLGLDNIFDPAL